ncbi:MAG TPA: DUF6113 family protein [Sporichthyaceae bacterium]|nr:DUF6113 family protein [Sporichthyaceae bacterium]
MSRAQARTGRLSLSSAGRSGRPASPGARPLVTLPEWLTERPIPQAIGLAIGLFGAGFLAGLLGAFGYAVRVHGIPVGVAIALATQCSVAFAAGVWNAARSAAGVPVLGWVVTVLLFSTERPAGSVVIAATKVGYVYLIGGLVLLGLLMLLPYDRIAGRGDAK